MRLGVASSTHAQLLLNAAAEKCRRQQCEEAITLLEAAARAQPGDAPLYYQLGFCHSGGCCHHRLVNPGMAVEYLRHALLLAGTSVGPALRAQILGALGNTLVESGNAQKTTRLREAISHYREAASIYGSCGLADEWAREEFNQANAWCELPDTEFPEKWAEAVRHYENALRVRTKGTGPERYAATVTNLGTALRQLLAGDRKANVLRAIRCYRAALRIYSFEAFPRQFANSYNNLGNACLTCPALDGASRIRHVRYALRHFERALAVWTCAEHPHHYALTQYNRSCAYLLLGPSLENDAKALACLTEAHECGLSSGHAEIARLAKARVDRMSLRLGSAPGRGLRPPNCGIRVPEV